MMCRVAGLFSGIGGLELGLSKAGHESEILVELDSAASHVLRTHFDVKIHDDVATLPSLPSDVDLVVAGFPCQDVSSVGPKLGRAGEKTVLVDHVFRLLDLSSVDHVLLENVPFITRLHRGETVHEITNALSDRGYAWSYRIVDTMAFGLPQRRRRWILFASRTIDPREVLLADSVPEPVKDDDWGVPPGGFYWTEGTRSLGWTRDGIPPLKVGSSIGVPSPPAVWLGDARFVTPSIAAAERLQGFPSGWTEPTVEVTSPRWRWSQVGNAVSVPVAEWLGERISSPRAWIPNDIHPSGRAPTAAWNVGDGIRLLSLSTWPMAQPHGGLVPFLGEEVVPLSVRAAQGFAHRMSRSSLWFPDGMGESLGTFIAQES